MAELFHSLGIEWKILIAQIINFAILFFVLRRFVIGPIMEILEKREMKLKADRQASDDIRRKVENISAERERILHETRTASQKIIKDAEVAAKHIHEELLAESHTEFKRIVTTGRKLLAEERLAAEGELKRLAGDLVAHAVEKAVGESLERRTHEKLVEEAKRILLDLEVSER